MFPRINVEKTGINIRKIMNDKGITVKQLSEYASTSVQAIYHYFQGKSLPSLDNLYAMSKLFQVPMDEIIVGESDEKM